MIAFACFYTCGYDMVSMVLSKAERREAKLMRTSAWGCFFMASAMFLYTAKIESNVFLNIHIMTVFTSENIILCLQRSSHVSWNTNLPWNYACTSNIQYRWVLGKTILLYHFFLQILKILTWNKNFFMPPVKLLLMISSEKLNIKVSILMVHMSTK